MLVRDAARKLGQELVGGGEEQVATGELGSAVDRYLDALGRVGALFGGPPVGKQRAAKEKPVGPAVVLGIELSEVQLAKTPPGGVRLGPEAQKVLGAFDPAREYKRLRGFRKNQLELAFLGELRVLMIVGLFSDETVVRRVVPVGSETADSLSRAGILGQDGLISLPPPLGEGIDLKQFNDFSTLLVQTSPLVQVAHLHLRERE